RIAAKGEYGCGLDQTALEIEPNFATLDFIIVRPFVQPALAAHFMLEVLHGIGDESLPPLDVRILQGLVEQAAGRANKGLAGKVFFVARLLADQHERRMARSLTRHRLRGIAVERATRAARFGARQLAKRRDWRFPFFSQRGLPLPPSPRERPPPVTPPPPPPLP